MKRVERLSEQTISRKEGGKRVALHGPPYQTACSAGYLTPDDRKIISSFVFLEACSVRHTGDLSKTSYLNLNHKKYHP